MSHGAQSRDYATEALFAVTSLASIATLINSLEGDRGSQRWDAFGANLNFALLTLGFVSSIFHDPRASLQSKMIISVAAALIMATTALSAADQPEANITGPLAAFSFAILNLVGHNASTAPLTRSLHALAGGAALTAEGLAIANMAGATSSTAEHVENAALPAAFGLIATGIATELWPSGDASLVQKTLITLAAATLFVAAGFGAAAIVPEATVPLLSAAAAFMATTFFLQTRQAGQPSPETAPLLSVTGPMN